MVDEGMGRTSPFVWGKKLYSFIQYLSPDATVHLAVVDQITESEDAPMRIIDSINQHNQGVVAQPMRFTFTIRIRENAQGFLALLWLELNRRPFDVVIGEDPATADETDNNPLSEIWAPVFEKYAKCFVTRRSNTIVVDDVPVATFNCIALERKVGSIAGMPFGDGTFQEDSTVPATYGTEQILP